MNWRALSLVAVFAAGIIIWQVLPTPIAQAQDMMKLPPGVNLKTLTTVEPTGIPGVKKLTAFRLTMAPGSKWPNMNNPAKVWDLCYEVSGTMTVKMPDGKVSRIAPGTAYIIPADVTIPLISNEGKVPAVDVFWHVEGM